MEAYEVTDRRCGLTVIQCAGPGAVTATEDRAFGSDAAEQMTRPAPSVLELAEH